MPKLIKKTECPQGLWIKNKLINMNNGSKGDLKRSTDINVNNIQNCFSDAKGIPNECVCRERKNKADMK